MQKYFRTFAVLSLLVPAMPAFSANEFEDTVPIELAKALAGNLYGNSDSTIYSDLPDDFPEIALPNDFEILGSVDQDLMQRVVLSTDLAVTAANSQLISALEAYGWLQTQDFSTMQNQSGFVTTTPVILPAQLCHEDFGNMIMMTNASGNRSIITLTLPQNSLNGFGPSCAEQTSRQSGMASMIRSQGMGVREYMPRLEVPESTSRNMGPAFIGGNGGGGSLNDYATHTSLVLDWPLADVLAHFARQLEEQDWTLDSTSNRGFLATNSWLKTPESDIDLIAVLSIIELSEGTFEMRFRLIRRDAANTSNAMGSFSGQARRIGR